ncbi:metal ABC transporter substrate-binding protein [Natrinema marinum]|uniref:metal ABC transporter substrate-binding protein n=1 Tax=Natrinema marinum TaxID=2961598 RepID=UPI0020C91F5B|nr:zinc ABC transporter substrate-binding protein [Natrinema marinum]
MDWTRRDVVKAGAGVAAGALAGCLDDIEASDRSLDGGYAAFFTLWDWAQRVSGDAIAFENPVGTGQAGHGWSPSGDLTRDIADAGVFVYFDTPEFSWAQDIAATLEADYDDVAVIDGLEGLEEQLLGWDHEVETGGHGGDGRHNDTEDGDHDEHDGGGNHGDGGHGHDESSIDPHVWLDPVLAGEIVGTIADGLADADPDNAGTYEEHADAYRDELEALDGQFEEVIDAANRQTAVYAGHDSFTYLQERYEFGIHTPVGVSPQEEPSPNDISETIDLVDSQGIETILYNPFEAVDGDYPLVNTIVAESDATDAMPVTHLSGTFARWQDQNWGYLEQMQEINVPAFREALDAQ